MESGWLGTPVEAIALSSLVFSFPAIMGSSAMPFRHDASALEPAEL